MLIKIDRKWQNGRPKTVNEVAFEIHKALDESSEINKKSPRFHFIRRYDLEKQNPTCRIYEADMLEEIKVSWFYG